MRLAAIYYRLLAASGLTALARRLRSGAVVLCYHNVVPEPDAPGGGLGLHMPLAAFERQMRWLADTYEVVPLEEVVAGLERRTPLRGVAAVTFDDAYRGVVDHAWPVLQRLGIPATIFVVAEAAERDEGFWWDDPDVLRAYSPAREARWLSALGGERGAILASVGSGEGAAWPALPPACRPASWQAIADAARAGLGLGAHSATHRSLPTLSERDLERELVSSRDLIGARTGVTPELFAYPYGLWNERVRAAVRAAGYRAAFTLEDGPPIAREPHAADLWTIPRVNIPAGIEDAAFQAWTAGLNPRRRHSA